MTRRELMQMAEGRGQMADTACRAPRTASLSTSHFPLTTDHFLWSQT